MAITEGLLRHEAARRFAGVCSGSALAERFVKFARTGLGSDEDGGPNATDDLDEAHRTQVWLAVSGDPKAQVTGEYFFHKRLRKPSAVTRDAGLQEKLLKTCERFSGVSLPRS